jgi:2',3'-cyclic-nucleotide 2'-phosphodiesterase (5'-nucleotidase family)
MNKKFIKILPIAAMVAVLSACGQNEVQNTKGASVTEVQKETAKKLVPNQDLSFTVLHVNDTHGRVKPGKYDGMGYARLETIAEEYRAKSDNVILLDAGDTIHGTVFAGLSKGKSVVDIMNKMNYVAMVPGNHDFNYGLDRLEELEKLMNFSIVSSNIKYKSSGEEAFKPYIIKELPNGLKIGIFGLSTPETAFKTNPNNVEAISFTNPSEAAREAVRELKEKGVHYIIALSHLGIDEDSYYTSYRVASEVSGIDMIVDGHSHSTLEKGEQIGETLIVQAGYYDKNMGKVDVQVHKDGTIEAAATLITKDYAMENVKEDEAINKVIASVDAQNEIITSVVIGESDTYLDGVRENVRSKETNLSDLITESLLDVSKADVVIINGGSVRSSISEGTVTRGDIVSVLPFGNYGVVIEVTGRDIKNALENGIQSYPSPKGAFPQIAGIRFEFDPSKEIGNKVTKLTLANGNPVDMEKTYKLGTSDFMTAGGDGYTMFAGKKIITEYESFEEILSNYIKTKGITHKKTDGRIKVAK